jgi:hypothetical protein
VDLGLVLGFEKIIFCLLESTSYAKIPARSLILKGLFVKYSGIRT